MELIVLTAAVLAGFLALTMVVFYLGQKTFPGFGQWALGGCLIASGFLLIVLRGVLPTSLAVVIQNFVFPLAAVVYLGGMRRFLGLADMSHGWYAFPIVNVLFAGFSVYSFDSAAWRTLFLSFTFAVPHLLTAALVLKDYPKTRSFFSVVIGTDMVLVSVLLLVWAVWSFTVPNFHVLTVTPVHLGFYIALMVWQVVITVSFIMLNAERLNRDLLSTQNSLKFSQDKYSKAFHGIPDSMTISRMADGKIVEANQAFSSLTGYSKAEALGSTTLILSLWGDEIEREKVVSLLRDQKSIRDREVRFRTKSGKILDCLYSGETIILGDEIHVLSIVRDITDRKKVEAALRESEEKYRTLVEKSNLGIMISGLDGVIHHANDRIAEMAGYESAEELMTIPVTRLYANLSDHERLIGELQKKGSITDFECLYVKKDGTDYWVSLNAILKNDDAGSPPAIHIFVEDITNRKRIEEELKRSQERLKLVLDGSEEGFWDWNIETGQVHRNERWAEMLGYTIEEIQFTVTQWDTLMHPDDRESAWKSIKDHLEGLTPQYAAEYRMLTKDKQWKWILDRAKVVARDNHGKPTRMSGTHTDTTERKRAEDLLHTTVQRYHTILSSLSAGVLVVTEDSRVEFVNQAFRDLFDLADMPENLHGLTGPEMIHKIVSAYAQPDYAVGRIQDIVAKGRPVKGEEISMLDGRTCMVDFVPIVVDGKPYGRLWLHYDITNRKRSEQEKLALQSQLFQSQKLEALGTLVGGIAHDFNNMLQIILGYSQFLLDDKKKGEPGYKDLQTIVETGKGGAELVNKLLAFGQQGQVFPVPLDLNHQISKLITLVSRTLPPAVQIDLDLTDGPTTIRADHVQVDQLILNLAINASEAMPNGGRLRIATTTVSLDDEYCRTHNGVKPGSYVMLSVSDNGRGMDKATLAKAFDPFFSTKERGSTRGTGLGLSVVKGIVQQQGGHVTCESEPAKGTTFKVYFPAIEVSLVTGKTVVSPVQSAGAQTILVVEDNVPVAELERRVLENAGYTVIVAANGQEALDIYQTRKEEISLVILDLLMPEMSGRDCLMEMLRIDPSAKVLIASGYAPEDELHREISPLVKGFVHKPFGVAELLIEARCALDSD